MKKQLKKRQSRGQKNLLLFACYCLGEACSGCGSVPSTDNNDVRKNSNDNLYVFGVAHS